LCLSVAAFSQVPAGTSFHREPGRAGGQTKILAEQAGQTQGSSGISVALAAAVRVIFAAWLVLALLLLGLGRLTMANSREPAPKRLSGLR
jgi:hypothetical protein